ncbi:bifunctional alpha/beta hydrolase/OsmC family protein [Flammeovirga sp. OC4]|uniref:bifunctional alpha/beta hydrolase/OsmC family protein n=1 Tax=Flammeovirga sp. OC4 TaxID=1382345 RepID=UPI0005C72B45|nr:bifunctional alpha/beta hydrolase/OsmC family protein [Flammeovirga sp. OC4]
MSSEKIIFKNKKGIEIEAEICNPADQITHAYALFAHCFSGMDDTSVIDSIKRGLNQKGISVVTLDFTGISHQNEYHADHEDILSLTDYMSEHLRSPQILIGHSLAGAACLVSANRIASVEAVVTISAVIKSSHIRKLCTQSQDDKGLYDVALGDNYFKVTADFIDEITHQNIKEIIHKIRIPLLIFHSPQDEIVDINNAEKIYSNAFHPKSFISLDYANHFLSNPQNGYYVGNNIANWSERYVQMEPEDPLVTQHQTAVRIGTTKYVTEVKAGIHHQIADEPIEDGGKDLGPNPYQFLLAGLGACTAMTLRMYADHKKIPLEEVTVHLNHENEYLKDAEDTNKRTAKLDKLYRNIQIKGDDLTEAQIKRLMEIANKCPVHRTLENNPIIITNLLEE